MRTITIVFFLSILAPYCTANAQSPLPSVELECSPLNVDLTTKEGLSNTAITNCKLVNDSSFQEEVDINIDVDGTISSSAPSSVSVGAGQETVFEVMWQVSSGQNVEEYNFTITATVSSVNGIPWDFTGTQDSNEGMIYVKQYGLEDLFIQVGPNLFGSATEFLISCDVSNEGNGDDKIIVEVTNGLELTDLGFKIDSFTQSVELKPGEEATLVFTFTTPESVIGEQSINLEFNAYSKIEKDKDSSYSGILMNYGILLEADASEAFFDSSTLNSSDAITGVVVVASIVIGLMAIGVFIVILRKRKLNKALDFDFD
mgnify:CR=1 FL=1